MTYLVLLLFTQHNGVPLKSVFGNPEFQCSASRKLGDFVHFKDRKLAKNIDNLIRRVGVVYYLFTVC